VTLPADTDWLALIETNPGNLLTEEQKQAFMEMSAVSNQAVPAGPISGYLLPWEEGQTVYLSQSTGHDQYIPQVALIILLIFPAANDVPSLRLKAGIVWRARWDVPNGDDSGIGNYLVIQDNSTNPVTYQLYLHLAQSVFLKRFEIGERLLLKGSS
jgi:hypothetical protein